MANAANRMADVSVVIAGAEYPNISEYAYTTDILQLGDPCSVRLPNPKGQLNGKIKRGDSLELYFSHPDVNGGKPVRKLKGIVTSRHVECSPDTGSAVTVAGADLGWHLQNNAAPLWFQLRGIRFKTLLQRVLDPSWSFAGVRTDNDTNRALKLGRAGAVQALSGSISALIPPIQVEPGEMIADLLILYARRARQLVNVSSDGYLQIWTPQANPEALYTFQFHADSQRSLNNIEHVSIDETIDSLYTDVVCVGTVVQPPNMANQTNPNEGRFRGTYKAPANARPLPFLRRFTFSDGDQLTKQQANDRARWRAERGLFDAWQYSLRVKGHVQNGVFYEPDNGATLHDSINGFDGSYYVSAVQYAGRTEPPGQGTILTLRLPSLLRA
jgi:prophage tail gpP-like protein